MPSASQSSVRTSQTSNDLRNLIEKSLVSDHEAVIKKLHGVGVDCVQDLRFLEESDLKDIFKHMQIRKFLRNIQQGKKKCF